MGAVSTPSPRALVAAGAAGSVLLAVSSYWVGATPFAFRADPPAVVDALPQGAPVAQVGWYVGVIVLALGWLGFGRRLWRGEAVDVRVLRVAGLVSAAPLLLATPLMSRDLWSYAAQAEIAAAGLDPYTVSPAAFGGPALADVSARWVDTASPYGPLWTVVGRALQAVTGDHQLLQVLVLRLPAALGFLLLVWAVPAFARRVGGSPTTATWLVVANPMVVLHGVGGGHNDTLMVGLLAAGLVVAVSPGPWWRAAVVGGVLVGLGASLKIPAVVAAPFLPLLWARYAPDGPGWDPLGRREAMRARGVTSALRAVVALAAAGVALAGCSVAAGHGLAWLSAANSGEHGGGPVGAVALLVVLALIWALALRDAQVTLLAAALLAPAMLSELSLAWYWFWPLVPAAAVLRGRLATFLVVVVSLFEVFYIRPNGPDFALRPEFLLVVVGVVAWLVLDHRWRPLADTADASARRLTRS